jgi:hypothetical protein
LLLGYRGQVTLEFIVVLAIVSIIFLAAINLAVQGHRGASQDLWAMSASYNAKRLADAIGDAYLAGEGAKLNVTLPSMLPGGIGYEISVRSNLVTISVPDYGAEFEWKTLTRDTEGGLDLAAGIIMVENINSTIRLEGV